ncbi:hypothetical protein Tco_0195703 [Tanacetum coccineum]
MMWAKEIPSWVPDFVEDNDEETDTNDETNEEDPNGEDIGLKISSTWEGDSDVEVVPDSKFEEDLHKTNVEEVSVGKNDASSEDPFNIYDLLNKKKDDNNKGSNADDSLKFPPGYTPIDVKEAIEEHSNMRNEPKRASGECFHSIQEEDAVFGIKKSSSKKNQRTTQRNLYVQVTLKRLKYQGSGYQQKDRKPSQNDKTEHGMEKTVQNQGQSPKASQFLTTTTRGCLDVASEQEVIA